MGTDIFPNAVRGVGRADKETARISGRVVQGAKTLPVFGGPSVRELGNDCVAFVNLKIHFCNVVL